MEVKPCTVGPILGETNATLCKIFGRGKPPKKRSSKKSYSVCRYRKVGAQTWQPTLIYFQQPHFDFSNVSVLNDLESDSCYEYQVGYVLSRSADINAETLNWNKVETSQFKTIKSDSNAGISFAFGSCRYLLKIFGGALFDSRGDKTFRYIEQENVDHVMMLGDQIYADDMLFISPDKCLDEYLERYRDVFSQPHFSKLVSQTPTYMMLDDHEIENDWPASASKKDWLGKYPAALHAYKIYQASHSPASELNDEVNKITNVPNSFWYQFENGCADFFVLDTRTERKGDWLISQKQETALCDFLISSTKKYKFVATSVPISPDVPHEIDDKWSGFESQRQRVLNFIKDNQIENVVFISGDVHAAMACEIRSQDDPNFKVLSLVASPFYWPYSHGDADQFRVGEVGENSGYYSEYAIKPICDDNYGVVKTTEQGLVFCIKSRKGKLLASYTFS